VKVVLFCGGLGLRLREHSEHVPKPMVPVGPRPVLWNVMRYYAHFGHTEFILCLGHQSHVIKDYFLEYHETTTNDFVLENGAVTLMRSDIHDWKITFVDTGLTSNIGQRLLRARPHLGDDEIFLANYADVLTDAHLPTIIDEVRQPGAVGSFLAVHPNYSFHVVRFGNDEDSTVTSIGDVQTSETWINGGLFALRQELFDHMVDGEELVVEPFERLIKQGSLKAVRHNGFWKPMDTLKEKMDLDRMYETGNRPWCVWEQ
jgi:glucose-1-phosphate cytidylyltransferase